jgi:hypothetical protein
VVGLCYLPAYRTLDLDYTWADPEVQEALDETQAQKQSLVVAAQTAMYFAPYTHEDRLQVLDLPGLNFLKVMVPERHDLAIMKITRGFDRDIEALAAIHGLLPFHLPTLVERYQETWVTGPRNVADLSFLVAVEQLFGEQGAQDAKQLMAALRASHR